MQLLQVCGGCGTSSVPDMRAELAILVDTLDLCCMWLQEAAAANPAGNVAAAATGAGAGPAKTPGDSIRGAEAAAAVIVDADHDHIDCGDLCDGADIAVNLLAANSSSSQGRACLDLASSKQQQQQQQRAPEGPSGACASSLAVCQELLRSIVSILGTALTAAAAAAAATAPSGEDAAAASTQQGQGAVTAAAAAAAGGSVWVGQWMWAEVGSCLLHHLSEIVSYSCAGVTVQLPITTLDIYLKVG
jgi:hypothetical protein